MKSRKLDVFTGEPKKALRTIGIAGTQQRIGTTTQALQMVKYLTLMGFSACYIEMTDSGYRDGILELYSDVKVDEESGRIILEDVDLYGYQNLTQVLRFGYDYCIKDYGSCDVATFEGVSFMEQSLRILVGGTKPNEIYKTQAALEQFDETHYIFNFVSKSDYDSIREMMGAKKDVTYFAEYTPDSFLYLASANGLYKSILGV